MGSYNFPRGQKSHVFTSTVYHISKVIKDFSDDFSIVKYSSYSSVFESTTASQISGPGLEGMSTGVPLELLEESWHLALCAQQALCAACGISPKGVI
jgi:hypothetical protein